MAIESLLFLLLITAKAFSQLQNYPDQGPSTRTGLRLSKPLIGDDRRIYACCERNLYAFESNGSLAWSSNLGFACNAGIAPVHGGKRRIYLVAENRVLGISFLNVETSPPAVDVFFGPERGHRGAGDIIGLAASTLSSCVFINVKNRGLFAYKMDGEMLWSAGTRLWQYGYLQGCRTGLQDCIFISSPVIDRCEDSLYIPNNAGELYSLSLRSPYFYWVQDLSSFGKSFIIKAGNNGLVYVTVPIRSLVLGLDVVTGTILWQQRIGPLSSGECAPVVDSNGWISVGSLDGFLYSVSPTGVLKKFTKVSELDFVVQVSPYLHCSDYGVYIAQTEMEGKVSHTIGESTYISAMKPKGVVFTLLVPATGVKYWSEKFPGQFSSLLSQSYLQNFVLDEGILLAFVAASRNDKPLPCRSQYQKLLSMCTQARPKHRNMYTGNERRILVLLFLESIVLVILAGLVRFCCIFWTKRKLQYQGLGNFLEKRHSLQVKKKEFDRTITELEKKAANEAVAHEVIAELGDLVRERESISRKLSTTYSLGRDVRGLKSKSLLPVYDGKYRSYSFQSPRKESITIFHTLSDTSSGENDGENDSWYDFDKEDQSSEKGKGKAKAPVHVESSLDDEISVREYRSFIEPSSSLKMFVNPLFVEQEPKEEELHNEEKAMESTSSGKNKLLKRRKTLFSTN